MEPFTPEFLTNFGKPTSLGLEDPQFTFLDTLEWCLPNTILNTNHIKVGFASEK